MKFDSLHFRNFSLDSISAGMICLGFLVLFTTRTCINVFSLLMELVSQVNIWIEY